MIDTTKLATVRSDTSRETVELPEGSVCFVPVRLSHDLSERAAYLSDNTKLAGDTAIAIVV